MQLDFVDVALYILSRAGDGLQDRSSLFFSAEGQQACQPGRPFAVPADATQTCGYFLLFRDLRLPSFSDFLSFPVESLYVTYDLAPLHLHAWDRAKKYRVSQIPMTPG